MQDRWEDWFQRDERLLWQGAPRPGIRHPVRNLLFTAFGVPFFGAGLLFAASGIQSITEFSLSGIAFGIFFFCFSLPFIGVGAGMVFGGWYSDHFAHKYVRYALTDKRGYIASRWWRRHMEVLDIRPDQPVEVSGGSSVYFHTTTGFDSDGDPTTTKQGFDNIEDAQVVYKLIRAIQAGEKVDPV